MSSNKLGELVCVLIKGKNLPNRQKIGKQDPYAICRVYQDIKKIKPDKNGGQHPEWDEEVRFDIFDKPEYKKMKISVFADDARDPSLIGESTVDLEPALTKGEFDDWIELKHKEKWAGEIYIELTFYSASAPPLPPPPPPEKSTKTSPSQGPRTQALPISMRPGFDASKSHIDFAPPAAATTPRPTYQYAPAIVPRRSQRVPTSHGSPPNQYSPRPLPALNTSPSPSLLHVGHTSPQGRPLPHPPHQLPSNRPSPSPSGSSSGSVTMTGQSVNYTNGAYSVSAGMQRPPMHQSPPPSLDPLPGRIRTQSWNGGQNPMYVQPPPLGSATPQPMGLYPHSNQPALPPRTSISAPPQQPQQYVGGYVPSPPLPVPMPRPVQPQQYGAIHQGQSPPFTMQMPVPHNQSAAPPLPPHPQQQVQSAPSVYPPNPNMMGRLSPQPTQYPLHRPFANGLPSGHSPSAGHQSTTPTPPPYPPKPNQGPALPPRAQSASPYQGNAGFSMYPSGPPGAVYPPAQSVLPQQGYPPQYPAQNNMSHPQQPAYPPNVNAQGPNWR